MNNYRNVYKSDHLGVVDLEEMVELKQSLVFTIREVKQHNTKVAGKQGEFNVAYFVEKIKPLVLNATNAAIVRRFAGGSVFVENWHNLKIELYINHDVKMKGEVVGGVRIKPTQPIEKVKPNFTNELFEKAKKADASIESIEKAYSVSEEVKKQYLEYVTA